MSKRMMRLLSAPAKGTLFCLLFLYSACASRPFRPCSEAGDLTGLPLVKGDFRCHQKQLRDGSWVNHGRFVQLHADGTTIALEGQFSEGVRTGKWMQYTEQGKPLAELFFDSRGVQKVGVPPLEAEPAPKTEPQTKVRE